MRMFFSNTEEILYKVTGGATLVGRVKSDLYPLPITVPLRFK